MIETFSLKFQNIKMRTKLKFLTWVLILFAFIIAFIFKDTIYWTFALLTLIACGFWNQYLNTSRENPTVFFDTTLIIDTDKIVLADTIYGIDKIGNIKILINEFDGQIGYTGRGAKMILNGTNNELSFSYIGKNICVPFYINSESQKEQFKILFDSWYRHKIKFYEGVIGGKTYLLQTLNYQQIQDFKKNYGLT